MIRKIIIAVLTLATTSVVVGSVFYSTPTQKLGHSVWRIDAQREIGFRISISELDVMYFTPNAPDKPGSGSGFLGIGFGRSPFYRESDGAYTRTLFVAYCPTWLAAALLGYYPAFVFVKRRRLQSAKHRRRKRGLCVTCGYDLRGSPDRCPECGTEIESP